MQDQYDLTGEEFQLRYFKKSLLTTFVLFKRNAYIDPNYLSMLGFDCETGIYIPFLRNTLLVMVYALFLK